MGGRSKLLSSPCPGPLSVGLKLIVDHMGVPRASKGKSAYRFPAGIAGFGQIPQRGSQGDGAGRLSRDEYPFRSLHRRLHRCFDAFGPERTFWGTDIHPDAMLLPAMRDLVHRRIAVAT